MAATVLTLRSSLPPSFPRPLPPCRVVCGSLVSFSGRGSSPGRKSARQCEIQTSRNLLHSQKAERDAIALGMDRSADRLNIADSIETDLAGTSGEGMAEFGRKKTSMLVSELHESLMGHLLLWSCLPVSSLLLHAQSARAEEGPVEIAEGGIISDIVIPFLLVTAFLALVVVTGGVIYLSYQEWQDQRAADAAPPPPVITPAKEVKPKRERATAKGFGKPRSKDD